MISRDFIPDRCAGIYAIINIINNKRYIGRSVDMRKRIIGHKSCLKHNKHHSPILQNSWNKYGKDAFIFVGIELFLPEGELIKREQVYIDLEPEYNCAKNAEGGGIKSTERPVCQYSLDGKLIAEFPSIVQASKETKIHTAYIYWVSAKVKNQNGYLHKTAGGFLWAYKGKRPSKYTGTNTYSRKIHQHTLNGNFVAEFASAVEAAKKTGIDRSTINNVCAKRIRKNGDRCLSAGGFLWRYKEEDINHDTE